MKEIGFKIKCPIPENFTAQDAAIYSDLGYVMLIIAKKAYLAKEKDSR